MSFASIFSVCRRDSPCPRRLRFISGNPFLKLLFVVYRSAGHCKGHHVLSAHAFLLVEQNRRRGAAGLWPSRLRSRSPARSSSRSSRRRLSLSHRSKDVDSRLDSKGHVVTRRSQGLVNVVNAYLFQIVRLQSSLGHLFDLVNISGADRFSALDQGLHNQLMRRQHVLFVVGGASAPLAGTTWKDENGGDECC